jgi:hypothetical protein
MMFCITLAFYLLLRARAPGISPGFPSAQSPITASAQLSSRQSSTAVQAAGTLDDPLAVLAAGMVDADTAPPAHPLWAGVRVWLWPLAAPELGVGVALAAAIALKASAAILVPVILAGLLRAPRRLVQVVLGWIAGGIVLGVCTVVAFGAHLPDLGAQSHLVIPMGLPNLLGLVLGQGGVTETMRSLLDVVLVMAVVGCSVFAWRRRDTLTASGWATMALLLTLTWVLPWYVLWVLPLAALSRSRALRTTVVVFGAYLLLTWMPLATGLDNALGIRPTKTLLGQQDQRYVRGLLN